MQRNVNVINRIHLLNAVQYSTSVETRVVDPDPAGSEIVCNLVRSGSRSVINFGSGYRFGSGSILISVFNTKLYKCTDNLQLICIFHKQSWSKNVFLKIIFLLCLDSLRFKCIFHKQSGSGSKIKVKSGSEKHTQKNWIHNTVGDYTPLTQRKDRIFRRWYFEKNI